MGIDGWRVLGGWESWRAVVRCLGIDGWRVLGGWRMLSDVSVRRTSPLLGFVKKGLEFC